MKIKNNKTTRFEISGIEVELLEKIKKESKKENMSSSCLVREILKLYFN